MCLSHCVFKTASNLAGGIDSGDASQSGAWKVDGYRVECTCARIKKSNKAMLMAGTIIIITHDLVIVIDSGNCGICRAPDIGYEKIRTYIVRIRINKAVLS